MRPVRRLSRVRTYLSVVMLMLAVVATGCGGGSLPDDVVELLDAGDIANVSSGPGTERVDTPLLAEAVARARAAGAPMRVVIVGPEDEPISATDIVARYGGTALSYKASDLSFEAYSDDLDATQVADATASAATQNDIGSSADQFVAVLEQQGLRGRQSSFPWLTWVVLPLAALFMISQLFSFLNARKRARRRRTMFEDRRSVLYDWAGQLAPEVEALSGPVSMRGNPDQQRMVADARSFAQTVQGTIRGASSIGDLDAAEMRISRAFIQMRDVRRSLRV